MIKINKYGFKTTKFNCDIIYTNVYKHQNNTEENYK